MSKVMVNLIYLLNFELNNRGWSRAELARRSRVSESMLSLIFSGQRGAGEETCRGIAYAFQMPPETIFRAAGILPAQPEIDEQTEELKNLTKDLDYYEREEVIEIVRLKLEIKERRGRYEGKQKPRTVEDVG